MLHISEQYAFSAAGQRRVNKGGLAPVQRPEISLVYLCDIKHNGQPRDFIVGLASIALACSVSDCLWAVLLKLL